MAYLIVSVTICCGLTSRADTESGQSRSANQARSAALKVDSENYQTLEQYGAKGDGSDDTAAILAAHAIIKARGFGGILLQPGKTYGIRGSAGGVLLRLSNLSSYGINAGGGATIKDLSNYQRGQNAVAFQFSNCKNIRIGGGLKLISQTYSPGSNETGLSWFKFVSGCRGIKAEADIHGGLHGFHFYRNYGEPLSASTSDIELTIKAKHVYYPELHERSGDNETTNIDAVTCGRAFFIFGGGNNVAARVTTKNCYGFLISSDSAGNGAENIAIDYRDRDSDNNTGDPRANAGRCGVQYYNQRPAVFRNIKIKLDVRNPSQSPFSDSFYIIKLNDAAARDTKGRGHKLVGLEISGISEQITGREHINTYGAFASPDIVSKIKIHDFKTSGAGSGVLLSLGNALADSVTIEDVTLPKNMIKVLHSTGKVVFAGQRAAGPYAGSH